MRANIQTQINVEDVEEVDPCVECHSQLHPFPHETLTLISSTVEKSICG